MATEYWGTETEKSDEQCVSFLSILARDLQSITVDFIVVVIIGENWMY